MESNDPKASRHVGRVVDPGVIDGASAEFSEPVLESGAPAGAPPSNYPTPPSPPPDGSHLLDATEGPAEPIETGAHQKTDAISSTQTQAATHTSNVEVPSPAASASTDSATELAANEERRPSEPSERPSSGSESDEAGRYSVDASVTNALTRDTSSHIEPDSQLNPEEERESRPSTGFVRTGHPVRDRLLAKAAEAQAKAPPPPVEQGELPDFSSLGVATSELDEIAAPKHDSNAPLAVGGTTLSSSNLLVFGTVCGLVAVVSLFTLLIQFSPRDGVAPTPLTPAASATVQPSAAFPIAATSTTATLPSVRPPPRKKIPGPWRIGAAATGQRLIEGEIGQEPFLKAIQSAGISKNQAYRVYTALKEEKNLDRCRPKDEFRALLDTASGRVTAFEYVVSKEEVYQAREGDDGLLKGQRLDLKVERQRVQGSLTILTESFADAARAGGLEPALGQVLNKALDGHTSVSQFQRGDRLRVVAQEVTVLGEFYRYAGIEALEYLPVNGDPIRIYYHTTRKRYYDAKGRAPGEGGWRRPVKDAPVTSKFNPNRLHPILKKRMPHNGTDFGAPTGTPIYAALYGTITKLGNYGANGNFIAIEHSNNYETGYSHLSRFEPGLKVGDKVKTMQPIGYVGSTGRSTGPHLHFSAKKNGAFIDPESLNLDALTVLAKGERAAFGKIKQHYDELLEAVALPPPLAAPASTETAPDPVGEMDLDSDGILEADAPSSAIMPLPPTPVTPAPIAPNPSTSVAALSASPAPTPAAPPLPATPAASAATAPAPGRFDSIYLTDKELMESQSSADEGEVEQ